MAENNESKEYLGKFPVRQDVTVFGPDRSKKAPVFLGWTIEEFSGVEIFKPFEGWQKDFCKALTDKGYYGDLLDNYAIKSFSDIKVGDQIVVSSFSSLFEANVIEINDKEKTGVAESEGLFIYLCYGQDDRNAWISSCLVNKNYVSK